LDNILFLCPLSISEKGLHYNSHSTVTTSTPKCESPFAFGKLLPTIAIVSPTLVIQGVHLSLVGWQHQQQGVRLSLIGQQHHQQSLLPTIKHG
jgi:hypothetical protein